MRSAPWAVRAINEVGCFGCLSVVNRAGSTSTRARGGRQFNRRHAEAEEIKASSAGFSGRLPAQNLVEVALGEADNGSPAAGGWRAVEVLEAAYLSAARDGVFINTKELYENH